MFSRKLIRLNQTINLSTIIVVKHYIRINLTINMVIIILPFVRMFMIVVKLFQSSKKILTVVLFDTYILEDREEISWI